MYRVLRWIGSGVLVCLVTLALAEGILHVLAIFAPSRLAELEGGRRIVLCVGDSHTYGAGVSAEESYPVQVKRRLEDAAPGQFEVLNLGVPGTNSFQVAHRLPDQIKRYQPAAVLVWVGVNDGWNVAERDDVSDVSTIALLLQRSRLYRYFLVRNMDRVLTAAAEARPERLLVGDWQPGAAEVTYRLADDSGTVTNVGKGEAEARYAFAEIARIARAAGVPLAFLTYPVDLPLMGAANAALRAADLTRIETREAYERVPFDEREFLWAAHPNAGMYAEIARDAAAWVLANAN